MRPSYPPWNKTNNLTLVACLFSIYTGEGGMEEKKFMGTKTPSKLLHMMTDFD
jgi:hypothetical protein